MPLEPLHELAGSALHRADDDERRQAPHVLRLAHCGAHARIDRRRVAVAAVGALQHELLLVRDAAVPVHRRVARSAAHLSLLSMCAPINATTSHCIRSGGHASFALCSIQSTGYFAARGPGLPRMTSASKANQHNTHRVKSVTHQSFFFAPHSTSIKRFNHLVICPLAEKKERVSVVVCCGGASSCRPTISTVPTAHAARNANTSRCVLRMISMRQMRGESVYGFGVEDTVT